MPVLTRPPVMAVAGQQSSSFDSRREGSSGAAGRLVRPSPAGLYMPSLRLPSRSAAQQLASPATMAPTLEPVVDEASAFSPATVANLGCGFDFMGCAVEGEGDIVTARIRPDIPGEVVIEGISGDGGRLSRDAWDNCSGIGAEETLKLLGVEKEFGVSLTLQKGLPLGSGLGSSAASAGAACWAVNSLFGCPLSKMDLVPAGLASEAHVSGYHADNIAPAIMGGFVMIPTYEPQLQLLHLKWGGADDTLWFSVVTPVFECPTKLMRAALPKEVPFKSHTHNSAAGASLSAGILLGDVDMLGQGLSTDCIVEPARGPLIPGFKAVKEAALCSGAAGCTISGAGPTIVAVSKDKATAIKATEAMVEAFRTKGNLEVNRAAVVRLCTEGSHSCAPDASTDMPSAHFII